MTAISSISTASLSPTDPTNQAVQLQMQAARKAAADAAAKALDMSPADLQQQLQSGKSLKDVASAKGVDFSKVQSAISSAVKPGLDQAVQSGSMTSKQEDNALARLTGAGAGAGKVHRGHHQHSAAPAADSSPDAASTSAAADELALLTSASYSPSGTPAASTATGQVLDQTA
jgi:hypothetical protein